MQMNPLFFFIEKLMAFEASRKRGDLVATLPIQQTCAYGF
jgi:hypothetical protein